LFSLTRIQELIVTEHIVQNEHSNSTTTNPSASRLLPRALIAGGLLAAAMMGATFVTPQSGLAHKAFVDSSRSGAVSAIETMKIVPADVLGTGASWSPRTGDGSN
jgi:redox-regulated HSP33 family molecular chaperone